ncbi:MAG: thioredoxin 1 [Saprospiraceae bacterium]|jgi:thioredoxin 1
MLTAAMKEKRPMILVFGADWSGDTAIMFSMMERLSQDISQDIEFFRVNIEKQKKIANFFGISTIPTTVMLKNGEVAALINGFLPAKKMGEKIREVYFVRD